MFIVDAIPATKIPLGKSQIYTYYTAHKISVGALVMVELYRRKVLGIVVNVQNLEKRKIEVKRYPYQLKEVLEIIEPEPILTKIQLKLARWISEYYWSPLSLTIKSMLPEIPKRRTQNKYLSAMEIILKSTDNFPLERHLSINSPLERYLLVNSPLERGQGCVSIEKSKNKKFLLFNSIEEKEKIYLEILKEFTKTGKQILFIFPEFSGLKRMVLKLNFFLKGTETAILSSELPKTFYWKAWQKIKNNKAKIILGTRTALFAPFQKLGLIIINNEQSSSYKSDRAPRYQSKRVALKLAELTKAKIILESITPSIESYWLAKQKKYKLINSSSKFQVPSSKLIDMKEESQKGNYSIFSEALVDSLKRTLKQKKQSILFAGRRGTATFIMCRDCGHLIKCPNCNVPLVHHIFEKNEILICHHCNHKEAPPPFCPKCSSYRIKYSGIGTQKVEAEIKKLFPKVKVRRLDSDIAKSKKEENKIWQDFINQKADILVGTQMILKEENFRKIALIGIISMDTILNIPDFRSGERVFQIINKLLKLSKYNKAKFILQTYHSTSPIFQTALNNDYETFYKNEIKNRETFAYPPFSDLIKLTYKNKKRKLCEENSKILADKLQKQISKFPARNASRSDAGGQILGPAPAFIFKERGRYIWQIIIKSKIKNLKLRNKLLELVPNDWIIDVDPESLL